ncbi:MAG: GNAT family N-acetyltransferase [Dehalococcoidia bacterium]|nr:MAG: GNAT family N-acetyltransferase [Dehalococcoidia bacterium]
MITIRPAESFDHDMVLKIWAAADLSQATPDEWDALLRGPTSAILVAEDAGAIVGAVVATYDGWRAYIYHLAVSPDRRREGIGKQLIGEAEEYLVEAGARHVHVMVDEEQPDGFALVARMGYLPEGDIVLTKRLAVRVAM